VTGLRGAQSVCSEVRLEREKSILKQAGVQHLYARLAGRLAPGMGDADLLVRLIRLLCR
jgi:isochorismate synthase EntC